MRFLPGCMCCPVCTCCTSVPDQATVTLPASGTWGEGSTGCSGNCSSEMPGSYVVDYVPRFTESGSDGCIYRADISGDVSCYKWLQAILFCSLSAPNFTWSVRLYEDGADLSVDGGGHDIVWNAGTFDGYNSGETPAFPIDCNTLPSIDASLNGGDQDICTNSGTASVEPV